MLADTRVAVTFSWPMTIDDELAFRLPVVDGLDLQSEPHECSCTLSSKASTSAENWVCSSEVPLKRRITSTA